MKNLEKLVFCVLLLIITINCDSNFEDVTQNFKPLVNFDLNFQFISGFIQLDLTADQGSYYFQMVSK